jgi:site-specific recombinase XerD
LNGHTLLLFLYNTGARISEAIGTRWADLQLTSPRRVRLRGKGRKERMLPIWHETADALHRLRNMNPSGDQQHVFVNHSGQPLTRDGVAYILNKHVSPSLPETDRRSRTDASPRTQFDTMSPSGLCRVTRQALQN